MHRKHFLVSAMALWAALPALCQSQSVSQGPHRMEITVERRIGNAWRAVDPGFIFMKGDHVRFRYKTNFSGYLYVMNQGTGGAYTKLFPREDTGMANRIEAGKEYMVPTTDGMFRVEGPPGYDVIYWVVTPVDIGMQSAYKPLPPPPTDLPKMRASLTPRCDDTILRARGECVDSGAGPQAVDDKSKLPENIKPSAGDDSQDLVFMKKQRRSVVSSPAPLGGPVVFEFRLAHK